MLVGDRHLCCLSALCHRLGGCIDGTAAQSRTKCTDPLPACQLPPENSAPPSRTQWLKTESILASPVEMLISERSLTCVAAQHVIFSTPLREQISDSAGALALQSTAQLRAQLPVLPRWALWGSVAGTLREQQHSGLPPLSAVLKRAGCAVGA